MQKFFLGCTPDPVKYGNEGENGKRRRKGKDMMRRGEVEKKERKGRREKMRGVGMGIRA
jgi:hypothetical protein